MIINDIFWDLIDIDNITAFIDDILVATDSKVGYKLVNEILKRMKENNIYINQEEY